VEDVRLQPLLDINRTTWLGELERIDRWASTGEHARRQLWWSDSWQEAPVEIRPAHSSFGLRVLGLADSTPSVEVERRAVVEWSRGGQLIEYEIDYDADREDDHVITALRPGSGSLGLLVGATLVGRPPDELLAVVRGALGAVVDLTITEEGSERTVVEVAFERSMVRSVALRHHDDRGRLTGATVLCGVRPPGT
jgi:hypothetical protein